MFRSWMAAAAVVAASALAGCTLMEGGDGRNGDLVRIVDLNFDPEAFDGGVNDATDVLAAIAQTRFEYTHDGDAIDPDGVTVEFTDESGQERSVPLSDFTTSDSVGRGDKVTITGALLTSSIRIADGDNRLASRGAPARDWLEAAGYPLPLAMRGGLAVWDVNGALDLDAGFDHIAMVEEGVDSDYRCDYSDPQTQDCSYQEVPFRDEVSLSDAAATGDADLDAKLSLDSVGTAMSPAIELGLEGTWVMAALFNVHVAQERTGLDPSNMDADFGFELDLTAVGDGAVRFRFDRNEQLEAVGGEGDLDVTGDVTFWDDEHLRSDQYSPGDLNDMDVHTPYEEQPIYGAESNPADFIVQALSDLWRMDLAPGDEFHLDTGERFGTDLPSAAITIRVVDEGSKKVPAGTFDALRVETTSEITVPIEGAAPEVFAMPTLTTWIDSDSGVPVAIEQSLAYDYDQEDFAPIFAAAETWDEGISITPPGELHIDLGGQTLAELEEWKDGLHMAPMASILLPLGAFASPFASFMFMGVGMGYGFEEDDAYETAPNVAFSKDETSDRLTTIKVESGLYHWDFQFKTSQPLLFEHNGAPTSTSEIVEDEFRYMADDPSLEFVAGDYVQFCSPGAAMDEETVVSVMHATTNTLIFEATFASIAACP